MKMGTFAINTSEKISSYDKDWPPHYVDCFQYCFAISHKLKMRLTSTFLMTICIGAVVFVSTAANDVRRIEEYGYKRHKRQAYRGQYGTGSGTTVKYRFHSSIIDNDTLKSAFKEATELWEDGTCLNFQQDEHATDGILVMLGSEPSCYTDSSRTIHNISLGEYCSGAAGMAHEIGHALGLPHAQIRRDRDAYVIVNNESIWTEFNDYNQEAPGEGYQADEAVSEGSDSDPVTFEQYKEQYEIMNETDAVNYSVPYDLGSIMQYSYSKAMMPRDANYNKTMGSPFVSFIDKVLVNKHYNCSENCHEYKEKTICHNNGFPDPKNCSICVCPSGYGGPLCKDRPNDCGRVIDASTSWKTITLEAPEPVINGKYNICTHWLKTEENNKEIQVRLVNITGGLNLNETVGCDKAGIEIKTNNDQRLSGYRFCNDEDGNISFNSRLFIVPIITYAKESTKMKFTLQYQAAPTNSKN